MIDKQRLDIEVKLVAIETILVHLAKIAFVSTGVSDEGVKQWRGSCRQKTSQQTLPGIDPAIADHVTSEIETEVDRIAAQIETVVANAWSQLRASNIRPAGP